MNRYYHKPSSISNKDNTKIGVVLPLSDEPYEIEIPGNLKKKGDLINYLSLDKNIFHTNGYDYNDEIELGLYWRNILTDYKKTPRTCIIFRFSKGTVLPENQLCQFWRADPYVFFYEFLRILRWKKTYGPIVILKIQDGNTQFRYENYRLTDYQQHQFYNQNGSAKGANSPKYQDRYHKKTTEEPGNKIFSKNGKRPYLNLVGIRDRSSNRKKGQSLSYEKVSHKSSKYNNGRRYTPTTEERNAEKRIMNVYAVSPVKQKRQFIRDLTPPPTHSKTNFNLNGSVDDLLVVNNIKAKVKELKKFVVKERWNYVDDKSNMGDTILYHYFMNLLIKTINYQIEGNSVIHEDKVLIDTGLKKRKTLENVYVILEKKLIKSELKLIVERFVTWKQAVGEEGFGQYVKPKKIDFFGGEGDTKFNCELFLDLNLAYLFNKHQDLFPKSWEDLSHHDRKLLFEGIYYDTCERLRKNRDLAVPSIFNISSTKISLQFLIPFYVENDLNINFVIAVRECQSKEGIYYLGCAALSVDFAYSLSRTLKIPTQEWLIKKLKRNYCLRISWGEKKKGEENRSIEDLLKTLLRTCVAKKLDIDHIYYRLQGDKAILVSFVKCNRLNKEEWLSKKIIRSVVTVWESIKLEVDNYLKDVTLEIIKQVDGGVIIPGKIVKDPLVTTNMSTSKN